jgi:hypothetical protein
MISPIGVYVWPHSAKDLKNLAKAMYGVADADSVRELKNQLSSLVLIELALNGVGPDFDVGDIAQVPVAERGEDTQVPYDETFITADGEQSLGCFLPDRESFRVVFFLHEFDPTRGLYWTRGEQIDLPKPTELPARLKDHVRYDPP